MTGRWADYPLMAAAPKALFAHFMVSFRHPDVSGKWAGWHHTNKVVSHNPEQLDAKGRPDLASVYTPVIGPYDMTDPDAVEHHCQLLKLSGIDGAMFDLGFYDKADETWHAKSMALYAEMFKRYGLKAVVIYEDKVHWIWNRDILTREEAVRAAYADMTSWLGVFKDVQYRIDGRPLFGFFSYGHDVPNKGESRLSPDELRAWKSSWREEDQPILMAQWVPERYNGVLDGSYDWMLIEGQPPPGTDWSRYTDLEGARAIQQRVERRAFDGLANGTAKIHVGGTWAGFDDHGCWGWGEGCRGIPRLDGEMYAFHWDKTLANGWPIVQIASWNDWFEGHNIEPAVEFGYKYLKMTREYAAKLKDEPGMEADLRTPEWIYKVRKCATKPSALEAMDRASATLRTGNCTEAETIVQPWVEKLGVGDVKYWTQTARHTAE